MNYGDLKPNLDQIARSLRIISGHVQDISKRDTISSEANSSVPAGYRYVKVTKTNGTGTVVIDLGDDTYSLTTSGSSFELPVGGVLPAFDISSGDGGTWVWIASK